LVLKRNNRQGLSARLVAPSNAIDLSLDVILQPVDHHEPITATPLQLLKNTRNVDVYEIKIRES
jgi:hypothetical protein